MQYNVKHQKYNINTWTCRPYIASSQQEGSHKSFSQSFLTKLGLYDLRKSDWDHPNLLGRDSAEDNWGKANVQLLHQ